MDTQSQTVFIQATMIDQKTERQWKFDVMVTEKQRRWFISSRDFREFFSEVIADITRKEYDLPEHARGPLLLYPEGTSYKEYLDELEELQKRDVSDPVIDLTLPHFCQMH